MPRWSFSDCPTVGITIETMGLITLCVLRERLQTEHFSYIKQRGQATKDAPVVFTACEILIRVPPDRIWFYELRHSVRLSPQPFDEGSRTGTKPFKEVRIAAAFSEEEVNANAPMEPRTHEKFVCETGWRVPCAKESAWQVLTPEGVPRPPEPRNRISRNAQPIAGEWDT